MASERPSRERSQAAWRATAYTLVSSAFAIALLVAAGLKAQALIAESAARSSAESWSDAARWAAIAAECLVGGWLLSGVWEVWARRASLALLTILVSVAGWHLYRGDADCGCFGNVAVHPAWTTALDGVALVCVFGLGRHRAVAVAERGRLMPITFLTGIWQSAPVAAVVGLLVAWGFAEHKLRPLPTQTVSRPDQSTSLICSEPVYNFGEVTSTQASMLRHVFILKNVSSHPLKIVKSTTSCGCTAADLQRDVIFPSESVELPVQINWIGRDGNQTSRVTLFTNEHGAATVSLSVIASIASPVLINPRYLDFGELSPGLSDEKVFQISPVGPNPSFRIIDVSTTDTSIIVRRIGGANEPPPSHERAAVFGVRVSAPRRPGLVTGAVLVRTSAAERPTAVAVTCRSHGAITATPDVVHVELEGATESVDAQVRVSVVGSARADPSFSVNLSSRFPDPPFRISHISRRRVGSNLSVIITISCKRAPRRLAAATLEMRSGEESLNVPLVMLAEDR